MIREARATDAPELAALSSELGYPSTEAQIANRLPFLFESPNDALFVADDEQDRVIGWIHVHIHHSLELDPYAQIAGLVVASTHRSRGLGAQLVARAEGWARGKGMPEVRVRSNVIRERAHAFYIRAGYDRAKTSYLFVKTL